MSVTDEILVTPEVLTCPYDYYRRVRGEAPVHQTPLGFWVVSRYDDVMSIVRDTERFSSNFSAQFGGGATVDDELAAIVAQGYQPTNTLLTNDPPHHTQFAVGLPLTVIADALGVDRCDMADFKRWSDSAVAPLSGLLTHDQQLQCARDRVEMQHYMAARCEERQQAPRDDLLTDLVNARFESGDRCGEGLSMAELMNVIEQLLVAGNETTTKLIAAGMLLLIEDPEQMSAVQADRSLIPNLVEEALRIESPVQMLPRIAKLDVEVGGVAVPAGAMLMMMYGCANRDEAKYGDAERFDLRRANSRTHLAFGQGPHFCVGAALARSEARIAFEQLLDRATDWAIDQDAREPTQRELSMTLRGLSALHVTFRTVRKAQP